MLIFEGICDVEWIPENKKNIKSRDEILRRKREALLKSNPLGKFNVQLNRAMESERREQEDKDQMMKILGFTVQRLVKGDALTVRGMSSQSEPVKSKLRVVAASRKVRVFELKPSCLKYLPPPVRVGNDYCRTHSISKVSTILTTTQTSRTLTSRGLKNGRRIR